MTAAEILNTTIVIQTDADFTPHGKRKAMLVRTQRGQRYATAKGVQVIRWYVGGRIYRELPVTVKNLEMTKEWVAA